MYISGMLTCSDGINVDYVRTILVRTKIDSQPNKVSDSPISLKQQICQRVNFTGEDLMNQVCATIDWIGVRMIQRYNLKRKILPGQIQGMYVLIFIPIVSKYKEFFLCILFSFVQFPPLLHGGLPLIQSFPLLSSQPSTC